jgi:hypothetical protein
VRRVCRHGKKCLGLDSSRYLLVCLSCLRALPAAGASIAKELPDALRRVLLGVLLCLMERKQPDGVDVAPAS